MRRKYAAPNLHSLPRFSRFDSYLYLFWRVHYILGENKTPVLRTERLKPQGHYCTRTALNHTSCAVGRGSHQSRVKVTEQEGQSREDVHNRRRSPESSTAMAQKVNVEQKAHQGWKNRLQATPQKEHRTGVIETLMGTSGLKDAVVKVNILERKKVR